MFEPENKLEMSLMSAAKNPASRPQFYRDLLDADIFLIHGGELPVKDHVLQAGSELRLRNIEKDGTAWLPIFSSLLRLQEFAPSETQYLQLKARDFFEIARGAYVILNPNSDYRKEFIPQEIERMLDGTLLKPIQTFVAKKDTNVLIGQPAVYPKELVKALSGYFAAKQSVNRAYLVQFFNPETDEKSHLLIGIDGSGDWEGLVGEAGFIASEVIGKDEVVDFMRLGDDGVSRHMIDKTKPIYQKSILKSIFRKN